jgi:hypothetical protein
MLDKRADGHKREKIPRLPKVALGRRHGKEDKKKRREN